MATTATATRKDLYRLIEEVNFDGTEIETTSKNGSAFLCRLTNAKDSVKPRIFSVLQQMRPALPPLRSRSAKVVRLHAS